MSKAEHMQERGVTSPVWSIILASRNGEDTLPRCLSALAEALGEAPDAEVLLLDNASIDVTHDIMEQASLDLGAQIISEPRAGKAYALNSAIDRVQGEWLLFIDDDILVGEEWLPAYQAAAQTSPDASLLAGAIAPEWEGEPPRWLAAMAARGKACGCTDPDAPAGCYAAQDVKGGNFAARRSALADIRFDEGAANLGGAAKRVTGGLDTKIASALAGVDGGIMHVPAAKAHHIISAEEMRFSAVFARQRRIGRNYAAAHKAGFADLAKSACKVLIFVLAMPLAAISTKPDLLGRCIFGLATHWGRLEHWLG